MERTPALGTRLAGDARRQALGAGSLALLLGGAVAVKGPTWGLILIGGALLAWLLLSVTWSRPDAGVVALAFLIPMQVRLNLPGGFALAVGFVAISALTLVVAYRALLAPLAAPGAWRLAPSSLEPAPGAWRLALALFAGAAVASLWAAPDLAEAARRGLYLGWFLALFWLTPHCVRDTAAVLRVARTIVLTTAVAATIGILQFALQFWVGTFALVSGWMQLVTPILEGERVAAFYQRFGTNWVLWIGGQPLMRAIGPFSGPPDVAQYLGAALPLALALALQNARPRARKVAQLAIILLFLGLSLSRQAWAGLLVAIVAMYGVGRTLETGSAARRVSRRLGVVLAVGGIVAALVLVAGSLQREGPLGAIIERAWSVGVREDASNTHRLETWARALILAAERPILGTGLGNYGSAIGEYRGAYSHNAYLDVLVETGPLGLLGLLTLLAGAAGAAGRVARHAAHPGLQVFGLGALGSVVALAVIFLFDDALYFPRAGQAFWLLLGLIAAGERVALGSRLSALGEGSPGREPRAESQEPERQRP